MRRRQDRWYERFGIEPPFPWAGIAIWSLPVIGAVAVVGGMMAVLLFGGDHLVDHLVEW
jgi:cytochrome c-type biogenesis protein CcmH/NrfF